MSAFSIVWTTFIVVNFAMIALWISAVPHFKRIAPEEFRLSGSPSAIWSPLRDMDFIAYLLRGRHRLIADKNLVRKLSWIKWLWLTNIVSFLVILYLVFYQEFAA